MKIKIAVLSSLLIATNAMASNHDNPWYAGARIGTTQYSDFTQNLFSDNNLDDDNSGGGLFVGYNFNNWFALETGYTYLGKIEIDDDLSIKNNALELTGKFTWQALESFDLFAKVGAYAYKNKGDGLLSEYKDTGASGTAGLGLEYHFTNAFSVRAEYQYYNESSLDDDDTYEASWDTHLLALGLVYSWGKPETIAVVAAPVILEKPVAPVIEEKPVADPQPVIVAKKAEVLKENPAIKVENQTAEVYFDTSSYQLSEDSIAHLQPIIEHLRDYPSATLIVIGHTDSRDSEEHNQILSEHRAAAVSEFLAERYAIDPARIASSGKGEMSPIADNDTIQGQAKNRRASVFSPSFFVVEE